MRSLLCLLTLSVLPCVSGCISINVTGDKNDGAASVTVGAGTGSGAGGASSSSSSSSGQTTTSSTGGAGGTGGSGGAGGAGGGPLNVYDACPGGPITVNAGGSLTIAGTTTGARDDYKTWCGDPDASTSAPDVVYQIGLPDACTLSVAVVGQGTFQPAFSLRPNCGADIGSCNNTVTSGSTLKLGTAAGYYSLVVDGVNKTSGDFNLQVTCDPPTCGDGVLNSPGEQCDSGPGVTPGDGCGDPGTGAECQVQAATASDTCATVVPVSVAPGSPLLLPAAPPPYNTIGANDDYHSIDPSCTPAPALDQVFGFTPTASGTLTITIGNDENGSAYCAQDPAPDGCWNHTLYLREGACETGTELSCSYPTFDGDNGVNSIIATVTAGTPYYLFVDGSDMTIYDVGPYFLQVSLQ